MQVMQHPNVEELEEAMTDEEMLYKVTPWYDGGELFDLAPMPEALARPVFAQLLDALEYVHSRGECVKAGICHVGQKESELVGLSEG